MSVVIHEYSHAWAADQQGDHTARDLGRLTINPLRHLDFFGSFLLPLLTYLSVGFAFGWAKPVPYNPYNLRDSKWGPAKVAVAGPLANFTLALVFGSLLRFMPGIDDRLFFFLSLIVLINLLLMLFNLVPIPPLDGSKVILPFLPHHLQIKYLRLEPFGMILVILFILFGFYFIRIAMALLHLIIVGTDAFIRYNQLVNIIMGGG